MLRLSVAGLGRELALLRRVAASVLRLGEGRQHEALEAKVDDLGLRDALHREAGLHRRALREVHPLQRRREPELTNSSTIPKCATRKRAGSFLKLPA